MLQIGKLNAEPTQNASVHPTSIATSANLFIFHHFSLQTLTPHFQRCSHSLLSCKIKWYHKMIIIQSRYRLGATLMMMFITFYLYFFFSFAFTKKRRLVYDLYQYERTRNYGKWEKNNKNKITWSSNKTKFASLICVFLDRVSFTFYASLFIITTFCLVFFLCKSWSHGDILMGRR